LEISAFSIVDIERNTGFALSARQTDPVPESSCVSADKEKGKVDWQDLRRFQGAILQ